MAKHRYNDDPALADVPLSVEEAAWLAANPGAVRGKDDITHLATRAAATANQLREVRLRYDDELRRRTAFNPTRGVQATMSPEAAVRFLSPQQLAGLFDRLSQDKLAALEGQRAAVAAQAEVLEKQAAALRSTVEALINDPSIPLEARQALYAAFTHPAGGQQ